MKLKSFALRIGETINMGNFNNVKYEVEGAIELTGAEDPADLALQVDELRAYVRGQASNVRKSIKGA